MKFLSQIYSGYSKIFGLSEEQAKYALTSKCPLCGAYPFFRGGLRIFKSDGTRLTGLHTLAPALWEDRSLMAECPKCRQRWPVFDTYQPSVSNQLHIVSIVETSISEEFIGEEQKLIDNSNSATSLTRRIAVNREWSQSYTVEYEKTQTIGGEFNIGIDKATSIKLAAGEALRAKYSVSEETRRTRTDEIVLNVPSQTKLRVFIHWKRLWQHGLVKLRDEKNREFEVPFKVAVDVTFDQIQRDEK